ncbi:MAG: UDP-glycosyltransferase [Bacteroidetes bacterium]|nr:UDP-glycosyltransferase [Bacteroidota bacterium]
MKKNKILILVPDGVGLRNFAHTQFFEIGNSMGYELVYWNNTPFDLKSLGFNQLEINRAKIHPLTTLLKNARKEIELNRFKKKFKDPVYDFYKFPSTNKGIKNKIKYWVTRLIIRLYNSDKGLKKICKYIEVLECTTVHYKNCFQTLKTQQPNLVFCTNQRASEAIAPLLAARELNIPTVSFIFSWDNLPKATMVVAADYYFVWSDYMKRELKKYYPFISDNQIKVTGTPQFEPHYNSNYRTPKKEFFQEYHLDESKKYICFSGDDITTSPNDPQYLEDVAEAVRQLNEEEFHVGIIFRRCPVDHSDRFEKVLKNFNDVITPINPIWKSVGNQWNQVMPLKKDMNLLISTIQFSEMVINVGSSMVFDFSTMGKPCIFINYNQHKSNQKGWDINKIYQYVHFRSMPSKKSVNWANSKLGLVDVIRDILERPSNNLKETIAWFEIINQHPSKQASERIWDNLTKITN